MYENSSLNIIYIETARIIDYKFCEVEPPCLFGMYSPITVI